MRPRAARHPHFPTSIAALLVVAGCAGDAPAEPVTLTDGSAANAVAVGVIDGDTIEVNIDGTTAVVRLIGIDTPEKPGGIRDGECYGHEATTRMTQLVSAGQSLKLELDTEARDQYDRILAYVHTDAAFVNEVLVQEGYAVVMRFEPNTHHADRFAAAERHARSFGLGLWSRCGSADVVIE